MFEKEKVEIDKSKVFEIIADRLPLWLLWKRKTLFGREKPPYITKKAIQGIVDAIFEANPIRVKEEEVKKCDCKDFKKLVVNVEAVQDWNYCIFCGKKMKEK